MSLSATVMWHSYKDELICRIVELESHQAAKELGPQLASLQRQLKESQRAEAQACGQLVVLTEVSSCLWLPS